MLMENRFITEFSFVGITKINNGDYLCISEELQIYL